MMESEPVATEHETAFVRAFIIRERRDRYLSQLAHPKKRAKLLDRLNHRFHKDLDARWAHESPPTDLPHGAHSCYVIASESKYDAQFILASDASDVMSTASFGIVVSYVPGRVAAHKDEAPSEVVWLYRA